MTSSQNILIASIDSGIGKALFDELTKTSAVVHGTSRLGTGTYHLDIMEPLVMAPQIKFDKLFFTICAENPISPFDVFQINTIKSFEFLDYITKFLNDGAQVVVLSSHRGSITELHNVQSPWYRMSKAALNMGVKILSRRWPAYQWMCLHPGLVDTGMTSNLVYSHDKISPAQCATNIIQFINTKPTFGFYDVGTGRRIPW